MPTFTTQATYKKGIVKPAENPPMNNPDEVVVTFFKYEPEDDPDEALFRKIEPRYRKIREEVVRERFPKFYADRVAKRKQKKDTN